MNSSISPNHSYSCLSEQHISEQTWIWGKGKCHCLISLDPSLNLSGYEPDMPLSLQCTVQRESKAIQPSVPLSPSISLSCEQHGTLCKVLMMPKQRVT